MILATSRSRNHFAVAARLETAGGWGVRADESDSGIARSNQSTLSLGNHPQHGIVSSLLRKVFAGHQGSPELAGFLGVPAKLGANFNLDVDTQLI